MRQPHHGRNGSRHCGRIRIAAAEILSKTFPGLDVQPEDVYPATGRARTDWRLDLYRWELFARYKGTRQPFVAASYQLLSEFVRNAKAGHPVTIDKDREINCYPEKTP